MSKILYSSTEIRKAIVDLFSRSKGRRVAITAFVGDGAESYLPKPKGIELTCWPKPGGTNPNALRTLAKKGVVISFADSLHMKVYWAEGYGAVITSANLSTNALGAGDLKELGIRIGKGELNIDRVLASIKSRLMTPKELLKLDREHKRLAAKNPEQFANRSRTMSFKEWQSSHIPCEWKLGQWRTSGNWPTTAKAWVKNQYKISSPYNFITCESHRYLDSDWILTYRVKHNSACEHEWHFTDHVVKMAKSDPEYEAVQPYVAVQVWPTRRYPSPPFQLDRKFRAAFNKAVKKYGLKKLENAKHEKPPVALLKLLNIYCK